DQPEQPRSVSNRGEYEGGRPPICDSRGHAVFRGRSPHLVRWRGPADEAGSTGPSAAWALLLLLLGCLLLRHRLTSLRRDDRMAYLLGMLVRWQKSVKAKSQYLGGRDGSRPRYWVIRKLTSLQPRC